MEWSRVWRSERRESQLKHVIDTQSLNAAPRRRRPRRRFFYSFRGEQTDLRPFADRRSNSSKMYELSLRFPILCILSLPSLLLACMIFSATPGRRAALDAVPLCFTSVSGLFTASLSLSGSGGAHKFLSNCSAFVPECIQTFRCAPCSSSSSKHQQN